MLYISVKVWFLDTNILAYWVFGKGGVLKSLIEKFNLSKEIYDVYFERYKKSISIIDEIVSQKNKGLKDEFFISYLAINELFSAIRDELRSVILFNSGVPISMWRDPRNNPDIKIEDYEPIYKLTLKSFDFLFENNAIILIDESSPEFESNYWEIYSQILFQINQSKTQDATLLTTAIFNKADYFITKDLTLIKSSKKMMMEKHNLKIIKPTEALHLLKNLRKTNNKMHK